MKKQVLFIQGAGEGAYKEDQLLADSLRQKLGNDYEVIYPEMPDEDNPSYKKWKDKLAQEIATLKEPRILVGHSLGASMLAKYLSEVKLKTIQGIFLIASPFWGGDGWLYEGYEELELPKDFSKKLPKNTPIFLYQCQDDEIVSIDHLTLYAKLLPQATIREIEQGGHQLNNDLSVVAKDIKNLN